MAGLKFVTLSLLLAPSVLAQDYPRQTILQVIIIFPFSGAKRPRQITLSVITVNFSGLFPSSENLFHVL